MQHATTRHGRTVRGSYAPPWLVHNPPSARVVSGRSFVAMGREGSPTSTRRSLLDATIESRALLYPIGPAREPGWWSARHPPLRTARRTALEAAGQADSEREVLSPRRVPQHSSGASFRLLVGVQAHCLPSERATTANGSSRDMATAPRRPPGRRSTRRSSHEYHQSTGQETAGGTGARWRCGALEWAFLRRRKVQQRAPHPW